MAAGHMLAAFLEDHWQDKPTALIFGTTQGKDVVSLLAPLKDKVEGIYTTPVISEPKSYASETIAHLMQGISPVIACESVDDAISRILARAKAPIRILVFGSLYLRVLVTMG
jgi:folylpolyglutamate synthase/dihydropteroate synthase